MQTIIEELKLIFKKLNIELFEGCLPLPEFLVTEAKKQSQTWEAVYIRGTRTVRVHYDRLQDPLEVFARYFLHQLIHIYCMTHQIVDRSHAMRYHNNRFKHIAEQFGLLTEFEKGVGYYDVGISKKVLIFLEKEILVNYDKIQKLIAELKEERKYQEEIDLLINRNRSTMSEYISVICPSCGRIAYGRSTSKLICGWCGVAYVAR